MFMFPSDAGDKKDSLNVSRSSGTTWGDLVTPSERIKWPKSHFKTKRVDVVYKILTKKR